jgi:hypothetical protein
MVKYRCTNPECFPVGERYHEETNQQELAIASG